MTIKVSDILKQVRITLDQNQEETGILSNVDEDTLKLDEVIGQKYLQAAKQVLLDGPLDWIDVTTSPQLVPSTQEDGTAEITLPADFLRLSYAKASDWKIPVRNAVFDTDVEYMAAQSAFPGIRPNCTRPMVAITSENKKMIKFLGSAQGNKSIKFEYIAIPKVTQDNKGEDVLQFPERLLDALYYLTAAYVALTYKDAQAQSLFAMARQHMGIPEQPQQQVKK